MTLSYYCLKTLSYYRNKDTVWLSLGVPKGRSVWRTRRSARFDQRGDRTVQEGTTHGTLTVKVLPSRSCSSALPQRAAA